MSHLGALASDCSKKHSFGFLYLEHVFPQTRSVVSGWVNLFPDEDKRESSAHRLGNLVPLQVCRTPSLPISALPPRKTSPSRGRARS
ncbi:DUF1524 domain-containing protein [Pseudomonas sp. AO-1]|uniref:GmrSD restriction endonuclease domain-containing protein n=1 Tax=Pseudomonas sp. AO-1 TaxID=2855434 RepID=UPI0034E19AA2